MALRQVGIVDLPPNRSDQGLDHADVHWRSGTAYIAHTSNDQVDIVDLPRFQFLRSVGPFKGVAGALVSQEREMVFTSNRGEDTVSFFPIDDESSIRTVRVGGRPNGLAFDPRRSLLLAANVGAADGGSKCTVSLVETASGKMVSDIEVPGRTRWAMFDPASDRFYVNIRDPAQIGIINPSTPERGIETVPIPAAGPHGLGLDPTGRRLFCACDAGRLVVVDLRNGEVRDAAALSGSPDVVFFDSRLHHLYVAIGDTGVIDVFDTNSMTRIQSVPTEAGAGTLVYNPSTSLVGAILQESHRLLCFVDE